MVVKWTKISFPKSSVVVRRPSIGHSCVPDDVAVGSGSVDVPSCMIQSFDYFHCVINLSRRLYS